VQQNTPTAKIQGWTLTLHPSRANSTSDAASSGLAVRWVEVESPLPRWSRFSARNVDV
jgi:protein tyrosine/serine phosphatase